MDTGTLIVTAYGRAPRPMFVDGIGEIVGQYGTCVRVNDDGWHDFELEDGQRILLNSDRFEICP